MNQQCVVQADRHKDLQLRVEGETHLSSLHLSYLHDLFIYNKPFLLCLFSLSPSYFLSSLAILTHLPISAFRCFSTLRCVLLCLNCPHLSSQSHLSVISCFSTCRSQFSVLPPCSLIHAVQKMFRKWFKLL